MNQNISQISQRLMAVVGLALVLASHACAEKKLAVQTPGKALKAVAPNPAAARSASASEFSAAGGSRENVPGWWF